MMTVLTASLASLILLSAGLGVSSFFVLSRHG